MRRLVELNPVTLYPKEIDMVRLRREAKLLKEYILRIPPQADTFNLRGRVLPIVEAALNDTLTLPMDPGNEPLQRETGEGLLPRELEALLAGFFNTAIGAEADFENIVEEGDKRYVWMEFE
jgi:hypothetical protein